MEIRERNKISQLIKNITLTKLKEFSNKTIVFTGFRDKEIEKLLENIGTKITTSVSKNTNYVIAADPSDQSNKIIKAKELDIIVLSKEEFYNKIK